MTTDLTTASATAIAAAVRERHISALEAVDACLARIDAVNPQLNAVVQITAETARTRARKLDAMLARGDVAGPLHGVPFTVKDWIETNDAVCAAGQPGRRNYVPKRDATAVARMRAAGAVLLGKTLDGTEGANNAVYGACRNPYGLDHTPGESSSGEAAIVAAGGSPLGLASDSGGSIRFPAHCCGVAGLKPSAGRVPLTGHFPRIDSLIDSRTQIGPIARRVEDLALALSVIAGPDAYDAGVAPVPLGDWRAVDVASLRVAAYTSYGGASCTPETEAAVRAAAHALAGAGARVREAVPPRIEEARDITMMYWARVQSHSWKEWTAARQHTLTADQIERGMFAWGRLRREMLTFMQDFDLVLCPAAPSPAPLRKQRSYVREFVYTLPYSLTGWPVVTVRAGTSREELPVGVQLAAAPWRDDIALAGAGTVEEALGGWQPPPE